MTPFDPGTFSEDEVRELLALDDEASPEGQARLSQNLALARRLRRALHPDESGTATVGHEPANTAGGDPPAAPSMLGRFEVRGELGRGGFGVVYLAFDPLLDREVAVKVPRAEALLTDGGRDRFRREAQAVAGLDHPNIVPVHEAGEAGEVCFLVSAYCPGTSLDRWLRQRREPVPFPDAAALVAALAGAMEHAHERGVVHRDLKPANILLASGGVGSSESSSGKPLTTHQPKITDFGLAKLTHRPAVGAATQSGTILGTVSYMAPEQAGGKPREVGPAADGYALGAILYELLTGRPPFQGDSGVEILLQVRADDPVPPSRLRPKVPRDLETVCLKCLEKDPARRYASAAALAADLRRFLEGRPVLARPVGRLGRTWRWGKRNPRVALLLGTVLLLLAAVAGVSTGAALRIAGAQAQTQEQWQRAQANYTRARDTVALYLTKVSESQELKAHGLEPLRKQLLTLARRYYDQFIQEQGDDPELVADRGSAYAKLAEITASIGTRAEAIALLHQARDIFQKLAGAVPGEPTYQEQLANSHRRLGNLYREDGQLHQAEQALQQALDIVTPLTRNHPGVPMFLREQAAIQSSLGLYYLHAGRSRQAEPALQEAVALMKRLVEDFPQDSNYQATLAVAYRDLATFYWASNQWDRAEPAFQQAIRVLRALASAPVATPQNQSDLAACYLNLGSLYATAQRWPEAEEVGHEAVTRFQELADRHPVVVKYQVALGTVHSNLALVYKYTNRTQKAHEANQCALRVRERLVREHTRSLQYHVDLGSTQCNLGSLEFDTGHPEEALRWLDAAVATLQPVVTQQSRYAPARQALRVTYRVRADALTRLARHADALEDWKRAVQFDDRHDPEFRLGRAAARARLGDHAQATAETEELIGTAKLRASHWLDAARVYAMSATGTGDPERSDGYASRAVELLRKALDAGYANLKHLRQNKDLDALRSRPDFRQLLADLEKKKREEPR